MIALRQNHKIVLKIIALIMEIAIILGAAVAGRYLYRLHNYKQKAASITIEEVDLQTVADGVYEGQYDIDFVAADVSLTVKDHVITDIQLVRHYNGRGSSAEVIIDDIITQQRLDVDSVSGATNSSLVIKKACENALKGK